MQMFGNLKGCKHVRSAGGPDPSGSDRLTKLCFSEGASTQRSSRAAPLQEPPAAKWRVWDTFPDTDGLQLLLLRMCSPALQMSNGSGSRPAQLSGSDFETGCFGVHPALHLLQSLLASQFGSKQLLPPRGIHVCFLTQQTCSKHVGATFHAFSFQIISRFLQGEFWPISMVTFNLPSRTAAGTSNGLKTGERESEMQR